MLTNLWDRIVRLRTWILNLFFAFLIVAPEVLNSPEVLAVIPAEYQRWVLAAAFLVNIWMRWRPATRADDAEVQVKKAIDRTDGPAVVEVRAEGQTKAIVRA